MTDLKEEAKEPKKEEVKQPKTFATSDQWAMCVLDALGFEVLKIEPSWDPNFRLSYHFDKSAWETFDKYMRNVEILVDARKLISAYENLKKNIRIFQKQKPE